MEWPEKIPDDTLICLGMIRAGAATQPKRRPGAMILENDPNSMVWSGSSFPKDSWGFPVKRNSR